MRFLKNIRNKIHLLQKTADFIKKTCKNDKTEIKLKN